jgi:hypothetical protein
MDEITEFERAADQFDAVSRTVTGAFWNRTAPFSICAG